MGDNTTTVDTVKCKLCGSVTEPLGTKCGRLTGRPFHLHRCPECFFCFVANPWTDYASIYNEDYYHGRGADPWVDYTYEIEHPKRSIHVYEWQGVLDNIHALTGVGSKTRWLDFGCGNGGLVRYCKRHVGAQMFGFEEGWIRSAISHLDIPLLSQADLSSCAASFDIITAIEVFEHIEDPVGTLALLRKLLKPGGLLFLTTGNPQPQLGRFLDWEYVYPEVHISYYAPQTMDRLLKAAGFRTEFRGYLPGFTGVIRYKVLKRLRMKKQALWEKGLPWPLICRMIDQRMEITRQPIAWG